MNLRFVVDKFQTLFFEMREEGRLNRFEEMGRAKIAMVPITNDKKRKITFNARKQGLIKKARELTTLCDVNLSMIIYTDDHENPEIFAPDCQKLNSLIDLYKHNRSMDPGKTNNYTVLDYLMQRKIKMEDELTKTKKKNLESKYPSWFDFLNSFSEPQLREFAFGLEHKIVEVKSRIESVKNVDRHPCYPVPIDYNDYFIDPVGNLIMQSSNNSANMRPVIMPSSYPDSLLNMMLDGVDNVVYDGGNLCHQPLLMEHGFQPELLQQFLVSDFASQSQVKSIGADGSEINTWFK